ncbi:MAG: hypothetical protein AB1403_01250 [Candidatus Riflebacteria bacterium]
MKKKLSLFVWVIGLFSFISAVATADSELVIHGLVSQGFMSTSDNNFLSKSESGSFDFNETIVNLQKQIDEKLRLGVQLMSRTLGEEGTRFYVDWGYGDYRLNDSFGLRFGRVKVPFGLYNKYRDIDLLRTSVFLPTTVYMEDYRQFISSFDGGAVYGSLPLKKGTLDFEFVFGGASAEEDSMVAKDWFNQFSAGYEGFLNANTPALPAGVTLGKSAGLDREVDAKNSLSAQLLFNNLVEGLRFGATRTVFGVDMNETYLYQPTFNPVTNALAIPGFTTLMSSESRYKSIDVGSVEYTRDRFTFAAELMAAHGQTDTTFRSSLGGAPIFFSNTHTVEGKYAMVDYRHSDKISWCVYRGEYFADRSNKNWQNWQKDTCLSLRYNISADWSIKIENHWMDGVGLVQRNINQGALERDWNLLAIKATYNF